MQIGRALRGLSKKRHVLTIAAAIVLGFAACSVGITGWASGPAEIIPYGSPESLDGNIGPEWEQSYTRGTSLSYQRTSCACSITYFPATVHLLHDDETLYMGLRMWPGSSSVTWGQFRALVVFDNGDRLLPNAGDDLIIVPAEDGQLLMDGLDYHYAWYSGSLLDGIVLDKQQDAQGAGKWHPETGAYDFEISLPMQSGDPHDASVVSGGAFCLMIGFEALDRFGQHLYAGKAPVLLVWAGP